MTQTPSSDLVSASPDEPKTVRDQQRLLEWLAEHDVGKYNLRNLRESRCPECGKALTLGVSLVEPFLTAWIALVIALLPPAGLGAIFICVFLNQLLQSGLRSVFSSWPPVGVVLLMAYVVSTVPLSLLAVWKRRRFMKWERPTQTWCARLAWGVDLAMAVIFLYEIH